jgi:short-subunit dehydrogenase
MSNDATRQCALVTGASAGIGQELARVLAANGFDLVLVARSRGKLEALAAELTAAHQITATVSPADLSEQGAAQALFDTVTSDGTHIDLLVNNAGLLIEERFEDIDLDKQLDMLQVNVVAMTALTHLFLAPMLERKSGRILNVASIASFMPLPKLAVYSASKAYVRTFGEALWQELSGSGVTVTTLCPGVTDTGMVEGTALGSVPSMAIMDPATVAREGYRACMAGTPVHIAGVANEVAVQWMKYQPSWLTRAMGAFMNPRR